MEDILINDCLREYQRYADTVLISAAINHYFNENSNLGKTMGFEPTLKRVEKTPITPDLAFLYDDYNKAVIFEIKWSMSNDERNIEKKIKDLKKYYEPIINWKNKTGCVKKQDLILICHPDDSDDIKNTVKKICLDEEYKCFGKKGFSIWTWFINKPRLGKTENMRLMKIYGETNHIDLEKKISSDDSLGILIPDEALTVIRFTNFIIREKPPVQYLMNMLIVNVLPNTSFYMEQESYNINIKTIYDRSEHTLYLGTEYEQNSIKIKRKFIREALNKLVEIDVIKKGKYEEEYIIPIKIFRPTRNQKPLQEIICKKLVKLVTKRNKKSFKYKKKSSKITGKETKLTDYLLKR